MLSADRIMSDDVKFSVWIRLKKHCKLSVLNLKITREHYIEVVLARLLSDNNGMSYV